MKQIARDFFAAYHDFPACRPELTFGREGVESAVRFSAAPQVVATVGKPSIDE
jgi:hypothetical protein